MNCTRTMLGIDAITKETLQSLVSKEGYLETTQKGLESDDRFHINIDEYKHTCILDVDHTLLFVRYFGDEMAVGDVVQFNGNPAHVRSMIYEIQVREKVDDFSDEYKTASYRAQIQHEVPAKGSLFTYIVENENGEPTDSESAHVRQSPVLCAEAVGCEIECEADNSTVQISFEDDSPELFALKPDMFRQGHARVELLHDGFLVRFRPRLADFLNELNKHFNVILFTAAEKDVYEGLLNRVHSKLINSIDPTDLVTEKLWSGVFFRDSCEVRRFGHCTYHVKNLSKFGIDMGRVFIVDNNPGSFRGFEPNAICCGDYFGAMEHQDDVLFDEVMPTINKIVDCKTTDVRYVLCDLPAESWNGDSSFSILTRNEMEDSGCEEEAMDVAGYASQTKMQIDLSSSVENESLQTSVQLRRHSFHAGSTKELSREIQTDRTIQFLRCLRRNLFVNARIEASNEFQDSTMMEIEGGVQFSGRHMDSDSEDDSVRTTIINSDDDAAISEAGATISPYSQMHSGSKFHREDTQLLGTTYGNFETQIRTGDSSMSVEYRAATKRWQ